VGLRLLACRYYGFESHRGHGYLSVVSVVCCQVEVCATGGLLVQGNTTESDVSEFVRGISTKAHKGCRAMKKKKTRTVCIGLQ